jgi:hypothetical protein
MKWHEIEKAPINAPRSGSRTSQMSRSEDRFSAPLPLSSSAGAVGDDSETRESLTDVLRVTIEPEKLERAGQTSANLAHRIPLLRRASSALVGPVALGISL